MVSSQLASERPLILVVDDEPAWLLLYEAILSGDGMEVVTAAGAKEGLTLLAANNISLLLTDYEMPEMNGHELAERLRDSHPHLAIVMTSGGSVPEPVRNSVDAFLPKAECVRRIRETIKQLLSQRDGRSPFRPTAR